MTTVPDGVLRVLGPVRAGHWQLPRGPYEPRVRVAGDASAPAAAVLTSRRPSTAATKVVDLWHDDAEAASRLLREVVEESWERGDVAVKWEGVTAATESLARSHGFVPMVAPPAPGLGRPTTGWVRWSAWPPRREPVHHAQSTLYTCGSVAALLADDLVGDRLLRRAPDPRVIEMAWWRAATNFPACEPVGLGLQVESQLSPAGTEVHLDTSDPVLLEEYDGFERDFRAEQQEFSRRRAAAAGLPVTDRRLGVAELAARIDGGELALLLVDEGPMHDEPCPHWLLAHGTSGGAVVVEDPWVDAERGETWVDAHLLPLRPEVLDRMWAWGDAAYRGAVLVRPGR